MGVSERVNHLGLDVESKMKTVECRLSEVPTVTFNFKMSVPKSVLKSTHLFASSFIVHYQLGFPRICDNLKQDK